MESSECERESKFDGKQRMRKRSRFHGKQRMWKRI
jgi:hypothetical protein